MDFDNSKPIYLQIADVFYENILAKKWQAEARIPSVREVAVMVEVNPNTAIRAFTYLQEQGVIYNKRGIGYFVAENGYEKVLTIKKKEFMEDMLPAMFKKMKLLSVDFNEIAKAYDKNTKDNRHEEK